MNETVNLVRFSKYPEVEDALKNIYVPEYNGMPQK